MIFPADLLARLAANPALLQEAADMTVCLLNLDDCRESSTIAGGPGCDRASSLKLLQTQRIG